MAVDASYSLAKYAVHALDHWQAAQAEARGEVRRGLRGPCTPAQKPRHTVPPCASAWPQIRPATWCAQRLPHGAASPCSRAPPAQEREPWEGRSALVYWLELAADLTLHALMLGHYLHLWWGGALAAPCMAAGAAGAACAIAGIASIPLAGRQRPSSSPHWRALHL